MEKVHVNALIIGGGAAGLWLLDQLRREGRSALLVESKSLGTGQTISAQGILHSGLKYSLQGLLTASAREARDMPAIWRKCLEGNSQPDLSRTNIRSQSFYLWGTNSASSKLGMWGARLGLQVTPQAVSPHNAPALLKGCSGAIFSVAEQVISCEALLADLAEANHKQIVQVAETDGTDFCLGADGRVQSVILNSPDGKQVEVIADWNVFAAGKGNAELRSAVGLDSRKQQTRPLHMVMICGGLPEFYGHCVDGATTRVSITSAKRSDGEVVWQVGGKIAEDGVDMNRDDLIARTRAELLETMPGISLEEARWATYRVERAEGTTMTGGRPDSFRIERDANVLTAWPTKLVLVPQLTQGLSNTICSSPARSSDELEKLASWPRPMVAIAPWDREQSWTSLNLSSSTVAA